MPTAEVILAKEPYKQNKGGEAALDASVKGELAKIFDF